MVTRPEIERIDAQHDVIFEAGDTFFPAGPSFLCINLFNFGVHFNFNVGIPMSIVGVVSPTTSQLLYLYTLGTVGVQHHQRTPLSTLIIHS